MGLKDFLTAILSSNKNEPATPAQPISQTEPEPPKAAEEDIVSEKPEFGSDPRTREELFPYFERIYSGVRFAGYELETKVPAEYFGANEKCAPVDFLFKKDGRDALAVVIVTPRGYKHGAVTYVRDACLERGIEHIRFITGYPNEEQYVVTRTLEHLAK